MAKPKNRLPSTRRSSGKRPTARQTLRPTPRTALLGTLALIALGVLAWLFLFRPGPRPPFDGERAFAHLVRQVEFGPRVVGTEAHRQCLDYLAAELETYAEHVFRQPFTYVDKHDTTRVLEGTNLVASFNLQPAVNKRILLAAHWDSRPFADKDPNPANHRKGVPGANDGASGVAVLLEMARLLHDTPPDVGVDIVLFDLEDYGDEDFSEYPDSLNAYALGSAHFVSASPGYRPTFGLLLDMVGDKDLRIPQEGFSVQAAPNIVDKVWNAADRAGATAFLDEEGQSVYDDHVPFLQQRIPVINLIHTPFPSYWHTLEDTPDKCSPASLQQVGEVLVEVIYSE